MALRGVSQLQIPQFSGIPQIDASNYQQYLDKAMGTRLGDFAGRILTEGGIAERLKSIRDEYASLNSRAGKESPYESRIRRIESEVVSARNSALAELKTAVQQYAGNAFLASRRTGSLRGTGGVNALQATATRASEINSLVERMRPGAEFSSSDMQTLRDLVTQTGKIIGRPISPGSMSMLTSRFPELMSLRDADLAFQRAANPEFQAVTSSQRDALRKQAKEVKARLDELESQAAERVRAAATQFNREQQQGAVAASSIRTVLQRPLTGRFGTPQTGVGIAARGAL